MTSQPDHLIFIAYKLSSIISLSLSLIAFIPQIIYVHHNKSFHNLSLSFITIILVQDVFNLLQSTLDFQIILSLYYCIIDCVLLLQYYYYHHIAISTPLHKAIIVSSLVSSVDAQPIPNPDQVSLNINSITNAVLLVCSRVPQVVKNYNNKTTKGISRSFILLNVSTSIFYVIALSLNLYLLLQTNNIQQELVLQRQLPLIGSSTLTILLDVIILYQMHMYQPLIIPPRRLTTRVPSWYTRNQPIYNSQEDIQDSPKHMLAPIWSQQSRGRKLIKTPETTSLMINSYPSYISPPPPPHYISSYNSPSKEQFSSTTMFSKLARSIKRYPNSIDSNMVNQALSPTSFIPSIIGHASSVGKKLNDESKVPFSPSDFLHDDYYWGSSE